MSHFTQKGGGNQITEMFLVWNLASAPGVLITRAACLGLPEALVVQPSLVGHPGGVPAGVLLLISAADLLPRHRSRLEPQRPVVRTFCGQGQMQRCFNVSSKLLRPLRSMTATSVPCLVFAHRPSDPESAASLQLSRYS